MLFVEQNPIAFPMFVLSGCVNFVAILINAAFTAFLLTPDGIKQYTIFPGLAIVMVNAVVIYAIARQGFTSKALGTITVAPVTAIVVAGAGAGAGTGVVAGTGAFAGVFAGVFASAATGTGAFAGVFAGAVAVAIGGAGAVAVLLLSLYVAWRVSKKDEKFALPRSLGVAMGAIGGTSFQGEDLTNANFTEAILKSTNFNHTKQQQTRLDRVCWKDAKKLDRARVGDSIPNSDGTQPGIKDLLTQLQDAIASEPQLTDDDKAEALEQVKTLAEAAQNPQDGAFQKAAKTATKIIKGTIAALPTTTALVEAVTKLLPLITKFFGF
jgi:Pentapeptide repeats (8 copies)